MDKNKNIDLSSCCIFQSTMELRWYGTLSCTFLDHFLLRSKYNKYPDKTTQLPVRGNATFYQKAENIIRFFIYC